MKKIFCLLIVLILVLSLSSVTAVAFAEEAGSGANSGESSGTEPSVPTHPEIKFNPDAFFNLPQINGISKLQPMGETKYTLDYSWIKNKETVQSVFENIDYELQESSKEDNYTFVSGKDRIQLEYCRPSVEYKDRSNWAALSLSSSVNISTSGWWGFRYVVTDSKGMVSTSDANEEHVLCRTPAIFIYFADATAPTLKLGSTAKSDMEKGIEVGKTYTIKTTSMYVSVSDKSSTTTTYKVYKKVNGAWTEEPIYDSATQTVAEGYEKNISKSGVITFMEEDVLPNNEFVYRIVYTVKDSLGYETVSDESAELKLFAVAVEEKMSTSQIWQIVLFAVAILALVGIIVVIFIKPREKATEGGRPSPKQSKADENKGDDEE